MFRRKKQFPFDRLDYDKGWFSSSIHWNPLGPAMPPTHRYSLCIPYLDPVLGEEGDVNFGSIDPVAPGAWCDQVGKRTWLASEQHGDGSIYVEECHHPIHLIELDLIRERETDFSVRILAEVDFTFEGASFKNSQFVILARASFQKLKIHIPIWNNPDKIVIPEEWNVPGEWTKESAESFAGRFVDLSKYHEPEINEHAVEFAPKISPG